MGDQPGDHAIIWARCLPQGGRVVASALGHTIASFDAVEHRQLLANAINWTMQAGADTVGCE
jgi:type 1 glutamine amidotransferase